MQCAVLFEKDDTGSRVHEHQLYVSSGMQTGLSDDTILILRRASGVPEHYETQIHYTQVLGGEHTIAVRKFAPSGIRSTNVEQAQVETTLRKQVVALEKTNHELVIALAQETQARKKLDEEELKADAASADLAAPKAPSPTSLGYLSRIADWFIGTNRMPINSPRDA